MILGKESYSKSDCKLDIKVGNYSSIAEDVVFHGANDNHLCVSNKKCVFTINIDQPQDGFETTIGSDVWIGRGAKILGGLKIGNGAIIGAWSVVTKDIPSYAVVVGNTARIIRYRFTPKQIKKLEEIKWWQWERELVDERKEDMKNISLFLRKYE